LVRPKKPRYKELYGDYPTLNEIETEYIKLASNPKNKLSKKTNHDIADMIGIKEVTIRKYRANPIIRKAIAEEIMMKSADGLGDVIENLRKMALGEGRYNEIKIADQLKANKDWLSIHNVIGADKRTKDPKAVESSIDKELEELEREYKEDTKET